MKRYDPDRAPDPAWWLSLDEIERIQLAKEYHRRARVRLPNAELHAVFHAIIENQVAKGAAIPVQETVERLMGECLSRHDAIHAVGSVLAGHAYAIMKGQTDGYDANAEYFREVAALTAEAWFRSWDEPDDDTQ